ncbi:hypothetical protein [Phaffia rhodozyma]|uniref:Uncharacterized protein n=1 Tax=Phaffia rhodozyma TaxID=264483 RepID=A0A0F7SSZ4_PHARH|nr:hypothetical protein [Phaffia rhodozyma]
MLTPMKYPHPSRMVFEALRLRAEARPTAQDLYETIHKLYPISKKLVAARVRREKKPRKLHGIRLPPIMNPAPYAGHPVPSKNFLKNDLLPYLERAGVIKSTVIKNILVKKGERASDGKSEHYWKFHPNVPVPAIPFPTVPQFIKLKTLNIKGNLLPSRGVDEDGLPQNMPEEWDRLRTTRLGETRSVTLAKTIHKWASNPLPTSAGKVKPMIPGKFGLPSMDKRPALPERAQIALDLKKYSNLNRRRQRSRVNSTIRFRRWTEEAEAFWEHKGSEIVALRKELDQSKDAWEAGRDARRAGGPVVGENFNVKEKDFLATLKAEKKVFKKERELSRLEARQARQATA